ncbi:MAG: FecR domain-containing protein [Saprospiraceae bacterium]|jgi:transmembrane sensor|nr:FecR domain-containing protein [Saprospiraceae bacterium]
MNHNYREYTMEELAQDSSFIRWAKQHPLADHRFWEKWIRDNPDKAAVVEAAKSLVRAIDFAPKTISDDRVDALWEKIQTGQHAKGAATRKLRLLLPLAVAASMAVLLIARFLLTDDTLSIQTTIGESLVYTLPDGSTVTLNALSSVRFDPDGWSENRSLELQGEAYFEVRKGSSFEVLTPDGTITVLGTAFNVFAREGAFKVVCFEGKVRVAANNQSEAVVLEPGMGVQLTGGTFASFSAGKDPKGPAWQRGLFEFDNERLSVVFDELQRQFDVLIQADSSTLDSYYTGFFEKDNLELALQAICWPKQLNYSINDRIIKIERTTTNPQ